MRPSSSALALLITTTAAAPSEICDDDPAVMVPSLLNAGRSFDRLSAVVSARMPSSSLNCTGSPLRCGISTGTTSSSNRPFFHASAARWCDRAENASWSSREMPSSALHASVSAPIACVVKTSQRPSYDIESTSLTSPNFTPSRDLGRKCGAWVMDSMPPATTTSNSPARISWSASAIASTPDRQTLLMVSAGTVIGMPASTAAWRAGICPAPACRTCPMIT